MPGIWVAIERLQGKKLFSKFDIWHRYNNIWLANKDKHKAAIQTCYGIYIPNVMYFRMCNAPAFFQRTMWKDFTPFLEQYRENTDQYMDNWWIVTNDNEAGWALHVQAIHDFLDTCKKHSYFLKALKCEIMQLQITLLGWLVTGEGLHINPSKVTGISEWPRMLTSVRQVHKTLGILGYQCPFIQGFAGIAWPIVELTKKGKAFEWTNACKEASEMLIEKVTNAPVLAHPDLERPFEMEVDALAYAVGAILFQRDE
jgi:RNase H-like domain found in reverse transcriptase/Reverse transcriptase (RNA-dependent DNA polymerase)